VDSGPIDRRTNILSGLDLSTLSGLEIGPLDRPLVRRTDGQVFYIDHADTPTLRVKYAADPHVAVSDLVEIDAVWGEKTLLEALGRTVDYVIASHVIEHVPDLITWFAEVRDVLAPKGQLRLAVPDRRYTFDFRRSETRLSDVVNAWFMKARKPLPHSILDFFLEVTEVDVTRAWRGGVVDPKPIYTLESALSVAADARDHDAYHDVHCWVFTTDSFVRLMARLAELGLVAFACRAFFEPEPNTLEFIVHLDRCDDLAQAAASWKAIRAGSDTQTSSAVQMDAARPRLLPRLPLNSTRFATPPRGGQRLRCKWMPRCPRLLPRLPLNSTRFATPPRGGQRLRCARSSAACDAVCAIVAKMDHNPFNVADAVALGSHRRHGSVRLSVGISRRLSVALWISATSDERFGVRWA